jgi:diketogulonate reductase-like aldo/keto reductase
MLSPEDAERSVREALRMGYRLVDTANAYVNERAVGRGMKESGVPREEVFLSTKLWPSEYENEKAVDQTLEHLGTDYVDACGIIGLNQESPINTGFERFGPFSLTRKAG